MAGISDLPMLHDIDADYSPQYVKLARVLRDKIESGQYRRGDTLPAAELAGQYKVSVPVTCNALAMLAANRYLSRPDRKSTRLNSSHASISYADFCLKKKRHATVGTFRTPQSPSAFAAEPPLGLA